MSIAHDDMQQLYFGISGQRVRVIEERLGNNFPDDDDFEINFKIFLRRFGITVRRSSRTNWIRRVAEHLHPLVRAYPDPRDEEWER